MKNKYLINNFYVIERNGEYWTDYLMGEDDCLEHIKTYMFENSDVRENYEYRLMTNEDIETHYPKVVDNYNENGELR